MHTLIVLIGPTGVGKTELSLRLAEHFHTCIVSADSRQLYADLKIGTAAPTAATGTASLRRYPEADRLLQCRPIRSGSNEAAGRLVYKA